MRRAILLALCGAFALAAPAAAQEALWQALREGRAFAMIRHAHAPGGGDPPQFRIGDCRTQRNLDARGRAQAQAIGRAFREAGLARARLFSSQWCRAFDTAELMMLGDVEPLPVLNSFFAAPEREAAQTQSVLAFVGAARQGHPIVLVTHQVNIRAATGQSVGSGDIVVLEWPVSRPPKVLGIVKIE
jgi:broad specificity phosphatase PhoE